ncbi:MAG: hypothetical protein ABEJ99_03650 [Candidatus Nanohaloarchaea archaeon]
MQEGEYNDKGYKLGETHGYAVFEFESHEKADTVMDVYSDENEFYQLRFMGIKAQVSFRNLAAVQDGEKIVADSGERESIENIADEVYSEVLGR